MPFFLNEFIMEDEMLTNLLWFLSGALIYKFLSYIFGIGTSINLFTQTLMGSLFMAKKVDEQMLLLIERQSDLSEKEGANEEQVQNAEKLNVQTHELWRIMIINTIISCCPRSIQSTLKFKDWKSAVKLLEK